ncbi:major facilitator superfamily protein [Bifidobacterium callitrichos DSM 23973]|uniref:Major facilitator superfamily protein n=2 Tax=Bifidobacterium callitrichos TaxID=762209 RepID=A0A087AC43_9BIFI|nr:major facilitator superfamily protein [Bifidobacterium callitrichos DSM 23973]
MTNWWFPFFMSKHDQREQSMKKSLLALAAGAFILGAAEFVMMGILPQAAEATGVDIPTAGHYISSYAIGVCVGTLILVFGRKVPPKNLIILFMLIALVGNAMSAMSVNAVMLLAARFISGLPHGAFFGTATLIAKTLADKGKEAQAVSVMVTGQTVANMLGVPAGTLMAEFMSWRLAFGLLAAWAAMTIVLTLAWIPFVPPVKDTGILGQFRFLRRRGPWVILAAVFTGNAGVFCWWSYVSPWLQKTGGWSAGLVPLMMMLAGFGMVVGGIIGGRITDNWRHAGTAALGQAISCAGLLMVLLVPGNRVTTAILTFWIAFGLFFISAPQQLLMTEAGQGGGELIAGAAVQVAFNFGNAVGSVVGGAMLTSFAMDYRFTGLGGVPLAALAVGLLAFYSWKCETDTDALQRMREIHV